MSAIGSLLGRVGGGMFQQAWVVEDLAAAEDAMRTSLGCSDFVKFVMDESGICGEMR